MKTYIYIAKQLSILFFALASVFSSCKTQNLIATKKNANNEIDSSLILNNYKSIIEIDDKISVSIWNNDEISVGSVFGIYNSNEVYGKWVMVDESGSVILPKLGKVELLGLTLVEANEKLKVLYSKIIVDPIIVVKVLNKEVTVLGEVKNPGKYVLEKEKNNVFEIIGMAGGIDFYGDIKNIKLIRNNFEYKIDLTNKAYSENKNFMILPKDIIIIPTKKGKTLDKKLPNLIPFTSAITAFAIAFSLIIK